MKKILPAIAIGLFCLSAPAFAADAPKGDLEKANIWLTEFEKEVKRNQGATVRYFNRDEALKRIQTLVINYPDDPKVKELYRRASLALMKSKGGFLEITPEMVQYKKNESQLREHVAKISAKKWEGAKSAAGPIKPAFPAPDPDNEVINDHVGRTVILEDVRWPGNQFIGVNGQLIHTGKPSAGFYYVQASGQDWLGPYEATKRYRRLVDSSLKDDLTFTVIGKITTAVMEQPDASEDKKTPFSWGWVVKPEYLYIPGHVIAWREDNGENTGMFEGEKEVARIKEGWFTVKDLPADAEPLQVIETFSTAIKEKNFELFKKCISPDRQETPVAQSNLLYHWDLHQTRFANEYVAVTFVAPKIVVEKGFDDQNQLENFFLDSDKKEKLVKMQGQKKERAFITSKAFDENGKQLGTPNIHELVRVGNGRWYVDNYEIRF